MQGLPSCREKDEHALPQFSQVKTTTSVQCAGRIAITRAQRITDLPAGGTRLTRSAPGLLGTWVNGVQVFDTDGYRQVTPPGHILTQFDGGRSTVGMPA